MPYLIVLKFPHSRKNARRTYQPVPIRPEIFPHADISSQLPLLIHHSTMTIDNSRTKKEPLINTISDVFNKFYDEEENFERN